MALQVRFLSTRTANETDFWWSSTDSEVQGYCTTILALASNLGIEHSYTVASDGLSAVSTFTAPTVKDWNELGNRITATIPGMSTRRKSYYEDAGHTLAVEWVDTVSGRVILKNNSFLSTVETLIY